MMTEWGKVDNWMGVGMHGWGMEDEGMSEGGWRDEGREKENKGKRAGMGDEWMGEQGRMD